MKQKFGETKCKERKVMEAAIGIWSAGLFFLAGLLLGRMRWVPLREEKEETEEPQKKERKCVPGEKRIALGWSVGSPVSGKVSYFNEGGRKGAVIQPQQGVLYAPASGKIVKLYPTGNAMMLRTDYGVELLMQTGIGTGDLETRYYRPKVVKNEVVNKGKLLLEFDMEGIRNEGYDPSVRVSVEEARDQEAVTLCETELVKTGENIMWIQQ